MNKTQHRLTKHEMKEDSFVTFAFRAQEYLQSHQRTLLWAAGALVLAVFGLWLYSSTSERAHAEGEQLLSQAFARVQQNDMQGAAGIYREVAEQFKGTPAAREATFYLANLQFVAQQWADAATHYESYLDSYADFDPGRNAAAHAAIGDAWQAQGDHARALEHYDLALAIRQAAYLHSDVYLSAARSALALGRQEAAIAYADRLFEKDGNVGAMPQMRELLAMQGVHYVRGF
jgi:tetratricopeptide (TPR) repeat protein